MKKEKPLTPEQEAAKRVRTVERIFRTLTRDELNYLLHEAGVSDGQESYGLKLQKAIIVWYGGHVPNLVELEKIR